MARTIGYFKYKTRTAIEIYGSGFFKEKSDTGYVYGWSEILPDFTLRAYIKTFTKDTNDAKAGLQFRTLANANISFNGIFVTGDNKVVLLKRPLTNDNIIQVASTQLSVHEGIWLQMTKVGNTITYEYSLNSEATNAGTISWTTLGTTTGLTADWSTLEKELSCSSGSDNVNLVYFTKVYTEDCWISPVGQKED